ncbi:MAG: DUF1800 domain-containing protein, partial [Bacteroidota bacterium]
LRYSVEFFNYPFREFPMRIPILSLLLCYSFFISAQTYNDYVGGGHAQNITVTTSSDFQPADSEQVAAGANTLAVPGLTGKLIEAGRFLAQATLGADRNMIDSVVRTNFETWIDQQFAEAPSLLLPRIGDIYAANQQDYLAEGGDPMKFPEQPTSEHFDYAWWQVNMTNKDLLRQRIAFALSEIFVISFNSDLNKQGEGVASYYDMLAGHAFGNFRDLLKDVALHPCMGVYLTHLNNPKANPARFIHPDENFAREMMQLFTIGLYELNSDGSRKKDADGKDIPSYDSDDVGEFAKIWTGLGGGAAVQLPDTTIEIEFGKGMRVIDMTKPMAMYEEYHEPGQKQLLNGFVVPAGQSGMEDIDDAIDNLFNHPNLGPFIGQQLIQRLVKSNPSPDYIGRVAAVIRSSNGDMKSIIKAVLLDEEARSCEWYSDPTHGKLKEPIIRYTHFARAMGGFSESGRYWNRGGDYNNQAGQHPMYSNSVFNFYWPDFQPVGPIADQGLVAPEFQVHNSRTSIGFVNFVNEWAVMETLLKAKGEDNVVYTNLDEVLLHAADTEALINELDILLTNGLLRDEAREIIFDTVDIIDDEFEKVKLTIYLMVISADYNILK